MNRTFGDSFYFLALLNPRDQHHARAVEFGRQWAGQIITTRWVLAEIADGLAQPPLRSLAALFLARLRDNPFLKVLPVSDAQFDRGADLYRQREDKAWSLTDCISFVVMADEGIAEAL